MLELQSMLPALQFRPLLPALSAHFCIVGVVTFLAQRREVQQASHFWPVVENMRRGQNHFTARYWVRLAVLGSAPFAAVPRPVVAHEPAPQLPVCRVSRLHFRSYRHSSSNPAFELDAAKKPPRHSTPR